MFKVLCVPYSLLLTTNIYLIVKDFAFLIDHPLSGIVSLCEIIVRAGLNNGYDLKGQGIERSLFETY
mgnify:FL=1